MDDSIAGTEDDAGSQVVLVVESSLHCELVHFHSGTVRCSVAKALSVWDHDADDGQLQEEVSFA